MPAPVPQPTVRPLFASLAEVRRAIRRFRLAWACVAGLTVLAGALAVAETVERWAVLRERTALLVVAGAGLFALLVILHGVLRVVLRTPSVVELALGVEKAHPELLDAFVCAVELESSGRTEFGPLEEALLARTRQQTQVLNLPGVFRTSLRWGRLALIALLIASTAGVLGHSRVVRKARFQLADWLAGAQSGLRIESPTAPVPEHTDVRVEVTVNRWEPTAQIVYEDADGRHRFPLNHAPTGGDYFTLYDVTGTVRFRIETPSLRSSWQAVDSYVPPTFETVSLRVRQPAYTGRDDLVFDEFRNCTAVVGSRVELAIVTHPEVQADVLVGDDAIPMQAGQPGAFQFVQTLAEKLVFRVRLRTARGFTALGPETMILGEPDLPPVVEVTDPRRDTQALKDETVYLEAQASDDFGIAQVVLHYTVSGGEPQDLVVHETPAGATPETEATVGEKFDLAKLEVKEGDVIAYAFLATDNRQPAGQTARSRVFFITVRPDLEEAKEQEGQGQGQQAEVDIGSLIAELKRLIRLSWDQLDAQGNERDALREELYRALQDLSVETRKKMNEILQAAGGQDNAAITEAFEMVEREILSAAGLVQKQLVEEAMVPEQRALAMLVAIENELLKNAMKSKGKGEGKQESKSESEKQETPPQQNGEQAGSQAEAMAKVREALDQVRRLAERQDNHNRELERAPDSLDQALAKALGDKQGGIQDSGADIRQGLADLPDAAQAVQDLANAEREMARSRQALNSQNLPVARPYGARAHQALLAAVRSLEAAQRKQAAERIDQLAQAAQQLSDAQNQAADKSRQLGQANPPKAEDVSAAGQEQRQLQDLNERLNEAIERTAGEFAETFPQASQALAEAAQGAREAGTSGKMTRAANALLYRRFDKAKREQTDAANELLKLSGELSAAGQNLPTMSREELLEAMRELQRQAQGVQQAMQQADEKQAREQLGKQSGKGAKSLEQLASALQDDTLQQIAGEMSLPKGGESAEAEGTRLLGMYRAAMRVLEQHLIAAGVQRKLGLSRETANPPEKYRRLVEQYFKDLSREK